MMPPRLVRLAILGLTLALPATAGGTIAYELMCALAQRVPVTVEPLEA